MSFWRNYVKMTSFWRNNDVIITSCVQGGLQDLLFICNSTLKTNDADMRQWTGSPLRQIMTRCLFGTHLNQYWLIPLQRRHNERDGVSNHRLLDCFAQLFMRRLKETSKLPATGLCMGNPPMTGGFPSQSASDTEDVHLMTASCSIGHLGKKLQWTYIYFFQEIAFEYVVCKISAILFWPKCIKYVIADTAPYTHRRQANYRHSPFH